MKNSHLPEQCPDDALACSLRHSIVMIHDGQKNDGVDHNVQRHHLCLDEGLHLIKPPPVETNTATAGLRLSRPALVGDDFFLEALPKLFVAGEQTETTVRVCGVSLASDRSAGSDPRSRRRSFLSRNETKAIEPEENRVVTRWIIKSEEG